MISECWVTRCKHDNNHFERRQLTLVKDTQHRDAEEEKMGGKEGYRQPFYKANAGCIVSPRPAPHSDRALTSGAVMMSPDELKVYLPRSRFRN